MGRGLEIFKTFFQLSTTRQACLTPSSLTHCCVKSVMVTAWWKSLGQTYHSCTGMSTSQPVLKPAWRYWDIWSFSFFSSHLFLTGSNTSTEQLNFSILLPTLLASEISALTLAHLSNVWGWDVDHCVKKSGEGKSVQIQQRAEYNLSKWQKCAWSCTAPSLKHLTQMLKGDISMASAFRRVLSMNISTLI